MSTFKRSKDTESAVPGTIEKPTGSAQCEWKADGERCRYPGSVSSNMTGAGAWYCSAHFGCENPVMGADIVNASRDYRPQSRAEQDAAAKAEAMAYCQEHGLKTVPQMRAFVKASLGSGRRKMGNTSWAIAILNRIERGEKVPIISERLAREALHKPDREPGEDQGEETAGSTTQDTSGDQNAA